MAENIFPSAGKKYDSCISRVASDNSLFPTQEINLYTSIYSRNQVSLFKENLFELVSFCKTQLSRCNDSKNMSSIDKDGFEKRCKPFMFGAFALNRKKDIWLDYKCII